MLERVPKVRAILVGLGSAVLFALDWLSRADTLHEDLGDPKHHWIVQWVQRAVQKMVPSPWLNPVLLVVAIGLLCYLIYLLRRPAAAVPVPTGAAAPANPRLETIRSVLVGIADHFDGLPAKTPLSLDEASDRGFALLVAQNFIDAALAYNVVKDVTDFTSHHLGTGDKQKAFPKAYAAHIRKLATKLTADDINETHDPPFSFPALLDQKKKGA